MTDILVDQKNPRAQVQEKYREVALEPAAPFHFHTGCALASQLGYPAAAVDRLPDSAAESFAGVGSPFALRDLQPDERVVDVGCGAGFDTVLAADQVGPNGQVIGVDMTPEMLAKARRNVDQLGLHHVEIREGLAEHLPVADGWADVMIANGVINLCADEATVFAEIHRVLRPGGILQFADIANGNPVPAAAMRNIDLWNG
jgi:arsenite methyltransferase